MVMAPPPPSSTSTSSSPASPPPPPPHSPIFSPINENLEHPHRPTKTRATVFGGGGAAESSTYQHNPTPLHSSTSTTRKRSDSSEDGSTTSISCNKCRPSSRDKNPNSIIPLDSTHPSPNNIFKSILSSIKRKSPKSTSSSDPNPNPNPNPSPRDDQQWKLAVSELSHKLIQATRKRDEALMEASRLKSSMAELEKKLNKLEIYCHNLNTNLEVCTNNPTNLNPPIKRIGHNEKLIESFCSSVSEARSTVRFLSRSLTVQLRQMGGGKVYERISTLLLPFEVKVTSISKNPRSVLFYLEALLNRAFYEDFESVGFQKNGSDLILNPVARCEASYASYNVLQALTWEEVLNKGTRHFSEEFSRFCDRKMSEIVAMLGWNRAWPEPLLQAFFGAAKNVWLVHLLACSVHPSLPIFRVDKDAKFDGLYMEDMGGDKGQKLVPATVRIMVAPGFYVYSNVVKCKVVCRYSNTQGSLAAS